MNCPVCEEEQPEDAKFCLACGANLYPQLVEEEAKSLPLLEGQKIIARLLSRDDIAPFIERWGATHRLVDVIPFGRLIGEDERRTTETLAVALVIMEKRD